MGTPSLGILLHEMIKLMYHAKCKDPIFMRIGTCGGIGVEGGTVIITEDAIDGLFRSTFELVSILINTGVFLSSWVSLLRFNSVLFFFLLFCFVFIFYSQY